ncbi:UDP-N-acetylmuramate--L-alanine ligase [Patescibacteria group bacterium]|nr:UDP-N-acetylmuramate--L-alanine ligase [Patescibacteria group bacterium]
MIKLDKIRSIHFTGIKGVGMTSLACCAQDLGMQITGTDVEEVFVTDAVLAKRKISWQVGFGPQKAGLPDLLVTTGAHGGFNNPEVVEAKKRGVRCVSQAEALSLFAQDFDQICVCGVGGKTTTSAMLATLFDKTGLNPSYSVGVGQLYPLGAPGRMRKGRYFIAEADEYAVSPGSDNSPRFTFLNPKVAIVTNIEHDHPDIYPTFQETKKVFTSFLRSVGQGGLVVACLDNQGVREVLSGLEGVKIETYGFSKEADWVVGKVKFDQGRSIFQLNHGLLQLEIVLKVPGRYNILNAVAAFITAVHFGVGVKQAAGALSEFKGTQRRFEKVGRFGNHLLYDDYAHHPAEIRATVQAAKLWFPDRRLIVVFQPHTYTRTKVLLDQFATAFGQADRVAVAEVYPSAREKESDKISANRLVEKMATFRSQAKFTKDLSAFLSWLPAQLDQQTVVLTMGAGDIFLWHEKIGQLLKKV